MAKSLLVLLAVMFTNNLSAQKVVNDTIVIQTKIYCDHCKKCESCQPKIEHELSFTKGVKFYTLNIQLQKIAVIYNSQKTTPEIIRQAVANSGYDADDLKANPKALAKLDGCCRSVQ